MDTDGLLQPDSSRCQEPCCLNWIKCTMSSNSNRKRQRQPDDGASASRKKPPTATNLADVPTSQHYSVSYMHRQTVTHACTSLRHGYVITGGADGVVKFWKRTSSAPASSAKGGTAATSHAGLKAAEKEGASRCLEFVKSYSSHVGPVLALCTSQPNGDSAVSVGFRDGVIKFYDVATFDVSGMIRTNNSTQHKFRLGRHAALVEREDLYLVISTRAPTREEYQAEVREKERLEQLRRAQEDDSDDDEGPLPQPAGEDPKEEEKPDVPEINTVAPGSILIYSATSLSVDPLRIISYHASPVTALAYHSKKQWVVSGDANGTIEIWNVPYSSSEGVSTDSGPLPFESKMDTDLYSLMKKKTYAIDIAISEIGKDSGGNGHFAVYSSDRKIRLFRFKDCKLMCAYDERLKVYDNILSKSDSAMGIDAIEYGKRAALEREMEDAHLLTGGITTNPATKLSLSAVRPESEGAQQQQLGMTFDNTGRYLLLPTIVGIKVINIQTNRVVAVVGKGDASSLRFINLCLCPGDAKINQQMQLARSGGSSTAISHDSNDAPNDSLLVALAYGKRRLYAFSHYDPLDNNDADEQTVLARDILNEAPDASDMLEASHLGRGGEAAEDPLASITHVVLRTTHGDIRIKLLAPKDTPRTIQNFVGHCKSGYYDNVVFHRIIPGFMIQTGDPLGDGTGGESIWGGEFEDEIRRELRHDRPFTVSMANAGPNTNGKTFY